MPTYLYAYLSICLYAYLSICLYVSPTLYVSILAPKGNVLALRDYVSLANFCKIKHFNITQKQQNPSITQTKSKYNPYNVFDITFSGGRFWVIVIFWRLYVIYVISY
jgi:hypothetical protein